MTVAKLLTRRGKWLHEWLALDPDEQEFWLAYEEQRAKTLDDMLEWATSEKDGQKSIDATVFTLLRLLGDAV